MFIERAPMYVYAFSSLFFFPLVFSSSCFSSPYLSSLPSFFLLLVPSLLSLSCLLFSWLLFFLSFSFASFLLGCLFFSFSFLFLVSLSLSFFLSFSSPSALSVLALGYSDQVRWDCLVPREAWNVCTSVLEPSAPVIAGSSGM